MRWLVTGATGKVGEHVLRALAARDGDQVVGWSRHLDGAHLGATVRRVELTDLDAVAPAFRDASPDAVIHLAALASIQGAASAPDIARRTNVAATTELVPLCRAAGARLLFTSTDMVFDGEAAPYAEADAPTPRTEYGRTKAEAERAVIAGGGLVARLSLLNGAAISPRNAGFFEEQLCAFRGGAPVALVEDEWRTPLHVADAAAAIVALVLSGADGLVNIGGPERLSRLELGLAIAAALHLDDAATRPVRRRDLPGGAARPRDLSLDSSRWRSLLPETPWRTVRASLSA